MPTPRKKAPKRAPLARHIRYDRKGWITQLTIRPMKYASLGAMQSGLIDTIKVLALELAKVEQVISDEDEGF